MNHQYINSGSINLAYLETNPEASNTIFFIHGNSCSSRVWYKQFKEPLLSDYRLIAFDLPGHGYSETTKNIEDNNLLFFGDVVAKAVSDLARNEEYILVGFSLGANVVAEIMSHSMQPKGIAIISPTIVGGDYTLNKTLKEGANPSVLFTDEPTQDDVTEYVHKALLSMDQTDFLICLEDFNAVKKPCRSTILKTSIEGSLSNEIMNLIQSDVPLFVLFGKEDQFINPDYLDDAKLPLWNNKIYKLSSAGHFVNLDQPDIFNDLLAGYCREMFK